jgi:hypothetical protein
VGIRSLDQTPKENQYHTETRYRNMVFDHKPQTSYEKHYGVASIENCNDECSSYDYP